MTVRPFFSSLCIYFSTGKKPKSSSSRGASSKSGTGMGGAPTCSQMKTTSSGSSSTSSGKMMKMLADQQNNIVGLQNQVKTLVTQNELSNSFIVDTLSNISGDITSIKKVLLSQDFDASQCTTSLPTFPIRSLNDLDDFEDKLKQDEVKQHFQSYISKLGGSSITNTVNTAIRSTIVKDIAVHFSFLGKTGKRSFKDLMICQCIIGKHNILKRSSFQVELVIG